MFRTERHPQVGGWPEVTCWALVLQSLKHSKKHTPPSTRISTHVADHTSIYGYPGGPSVHRDVKGTDTSTWWDPDRSGPIGDVG